MTESRIGGEGYHGEQSLRVHWVEKNLGKLEYWRVEQEKITVVTRGAVVCGECHRARFLFINRGGISRCRECDEIFAGRRIIV